MSQLENAVGICRCCGETINNVERWLLEASPGVWACPTCFGSFRQSTRASLKKLRDNKRK